MNYSVISRRGLLIAVILIIVILGVTVVEYIRQVLMTTSAIPSPPFPPGPSLRSNFPPSLEKITIFSINEYIDWPLMVNLSAKVDSEMLIRAWFKWREAHDYEREAYLIDMVHNNNQLFCGGVTMSALYIGENGISLQEFYDMVTRDPYGNLYPAFGRPDAGYYHGSLANRRYLDYVLSFAYRQIDAGVDCLFMDEVDGAYTIHEGYDDYGIAAFRDWLIRRFCDGEGWSLTDGRWVERLKIPLDNPNVCPDGSMASFNYREYLLYHGWADDPGTTENPLAPLWGSSSTSTGDDYTTYRNYMAWSYVSGKIREYARSKGKNVLITANGLNRFVDFQMRGIWGDWPVKHGRLDCSIPSLFTWRSYVLRSRELLGRDVPVVLFHDWGFGMPWQEIPLTDRINWLRIYAAEIYAAGAYFAFPVHGPYNDAKRDGTLEWIAYLAQFYLAHSDIYHNRTWLSPREICIANNTTGKGGISIAFWEQKEFNRRVIHLINHHYQNHMIIPQYNLVIRLPSTKTPTRIYAISPSFRGERDLDFQMQEEEVQIKLPELQDYVVVLLDYKELPEKTRYSDKILFSNFEWRRPKANKFVVPNTVASPSMASEILAFIQGNYHPDLKNNPTFLVDYTVDGFFVVHVNSVATQGAILVIYVDGVKVFERILPDKDGINDGYAWEYDEELTISIPAGKHEIKVDNTGGDWLSIDHYVLANYVIEESDSGSDSRYSLENVP